MHNVTGDTKNLPRRMERKFFIAPARVGLAYGLLQHACCPAPEYACEQINSIYFDTADLDQHARSLAGDFRKDKVRIRWYGDNTDSHDLQPAFLELKSREGFSSFKQRLELSIPAESLEIKCPGDGIVSKTLLYDTLANFGYFPPAPLEPVIKISYKRCRFIDVFSGQRIALDCNIRSTCITGRIGNGELELKLPGAVMEIKGSSLELPLTLRNIKLLDVDWSRFSKYSSCLEAHMEAPGAAGRLSPSGKIIQI